ncbi:hypothetical protein NEAUS04_2457 [Nematocida ausubeli]|uniref:Uncharacterized protein n=1 Tax=Nematocida ausubeli (strain ATCC PRA-371 / ERTm2) TaxID=1913371 RepID=A0A086IZS7_NEMA1|nr:uncharacterized protein NESG_02169 [Nematocida ausubeli]KAI5165201.1 hypothetical protein NEAUS04_2457 [Nematocida ausubeli]KFG25395.1 hypothetical protein NESG_02169 [Nematocida ausubeli]
MPSLYTAVYSHRNDLLYESETEGINRMLVHSAVEIMDYGTRGAKKDLFIKIVEYNGRKVSGVLLENGYKVMCVFASEENEVQEIQEAASMFRQKVLQGEFNRFEF